MTEPNPTSCVDLPTPPAAKVGETWRIWLLLFIGAALLYALTASRGVQWQDPGANILRVATGEWINPLGLALSHPLHHILALLAAAPGLLETALAVTLVSAFTGALAVANTYGAAMALTQRRLPAVYAALSLAVAQTFWQMATIAETYTLTAALFAAECWCLALFLRGGRSRYLLAALFLNGLGISNHLLAVLSTPVLVAVVVYCLRARRIAWRELALAAALWLIGTLPYSALVATHLVRSGDVVGTLHSALFGHAYAGAVLNASIQPRVLMISFGFLGLSFPSLLLPLAIHGIVRSFRGALPRPLAFALLVELLLHAGFVLRYNIVDQNTFFLPMFTLLCMFGGMGLSGVLAWSPGAKRKVVLVASLVTLVWTPAVGALAPTIIRRSGVLDSIVRNKPYRDDYTYLFIPWSIADDSADRLSRKAVELAGDDGLIVMEDSMASFAVRYRVIESGKTQIVVASAKDEAALTAAIAAGKPIVLVPLDTDQPATPLPAGQWQRADQLYIWQSE
nr:DUF2723 domain-containing protein [uncultured Ilyobacter sp.]